MSRTDALGGARRSGQNGRMPWGTLSRAQIVDAAVKIIERGDYENMTIRSLATELGASPMSLYRHVRDRDDLLDDVVDRLLAARWRPRAAESDWRKYVAEAAEKLRVLIVEQASALHVYLTHPVVSPAAVQRMDAMMRALRSAGLNERGARRAYGAVHTYTVGFAALEAGRAGWNPPGDDADDVPHYLARLTSRQQFNTGLQYLLDSIEREGAGR